MTGQARHDRFHGRVGGGAHRCAVPGCPESGDFRAPAAPGGGGEAPADRWQWMCLDHVRAFNAGYNFFAGMTADEIHQAQRPTAGWERETRAFAGAAGATPRWRDFTDPLDAIGARFEETLAARRTARAAAQASAARGLTAADNAALKTLGLGPDADRSAIRKAYSALVRRFHPDRNGGDRSHEKALQQVIDAYTHLRKVAAFA